MAGEKALVAKAVEALRAEAAAQGIPDDVLGRTLLNAALDIWKEKRKIPDIQSELQFISENLDPDAEFSFMRP
ncbi:hypothetical protein [Zavarzinia sp. CC-PAN008]|uniref:hypothetical protein n=1 Tax=Zavarzinia sp. CC-PAN008 TaxID=3243332 RepID=UPI003F745CA2